MRKKLFIGLATAIMTAAMLLSCSNGSRIGKGKRMNVDGSGGNYTKLHADWQYYATEQELIEASDAVFVGTVRKISFTVIDWKTGSKELKEDSDPMLQTVYTIGITQTCKGNDSGEAEIMTAGGIPNFREDEQKQLWNAVKQSEKFPIIPEFEPLVEGETYLFFVKRIGENSHYSVVNADQFAMDPGCSFAENAIRMTKEMKTDIK